MSDENKFAKQECPVCMGDFDHPQDTGSHLPCGHWFCKSCVATVTKSAPEFRRCPVCRRPAELICPPAPVIRPADAAHFVGDIAILDHTSAPLRRCRMWIRAEPATPPKQCTRHAVWKDANSTAFCMQHARPLLMRGAVPVETVHCQAMTRGKKAVAARRCSLFGDRQSGLCDPHCRELFGARSRLPSFRVNAQDEQLIEAAVRSIREP